MSHLAGNARLYNMSASAAEELDVAGQHPHIVAQLTQQYLAWDALNAPDLPFLSMQEDLWWTRPRRPPPVPPQPPPPPLPPTSPSPHPPMHPQQLPLQLPALSPPLSSPRLPPVPMVPRPSLSPTPPPSTPPLPPRTPRCPKPSQTTCDAADTMAGGAAAHSPRFACQFIFDEHDCPSNVELTLAS